MISTFIGRHIPESAVALRVKLDAVRQALANAEMRNDARAENRIALLEDAIAAAERREAAWGKAAAAGEEAKRWHASVDHNAQQLLDAAVTNANAGDFEAAVQKLRNILSLRPEWAEVHYNLGVAFNALNKIESAIAAFRKAVDLRPEFALAQYNLGEALFQQNRCDDAMVCYERAFAADPDFGAARLALCMGQLPGLYQNEAEIGLRRAAYERELDSLCADAGTALSWSALGQALGANRPFFLAYQNRNDRDLQHRYGVMACRAMSALYPDVALPPAPKPGAKLRIGFVSGFFREHPVWRVLLRGWLSQLNRDRFLCLGYHTGALRDAATRQAAAQCDRFVQGPLSLSDWRAAILADAPDVLIYPEIGMDPFAIQLAAQRLARVQCTSWGHPDTSGFPTIDYFLSGTLMEPPDAVDHYAEKLVLLPNLGIYWEPEASSTATISRAALSLRPDAVIFRCAQAMFKYLPQYDRILTTIARAAGNCQFAFAHTGTPDIANAFRARISAAFEAEGLKPKEYCAFLPPLDPRQYLAAISQCDIFLDTIGFGGGTTTLESLAYDLPIVTMPGPLMRGRQSAAILMAMGVTDTVVESVDDYIAMAIRLARDAPWRQQISDKIRTNKHLMYRDSHCISALEQFLLRAAADEMMAPASTRSISG